MGKLGSFRRICILILFFIAVFSYAASEVDEIMADYEFFTNYEVIKDLGLAESFEVSTDTATDADIVVSTEAAGEY